MTDQPLVPAKAGIQWGTGSILWVPAFAGTSGIVVP
jgi:hypothetical protein